MARFPLIDGWEIGWSQDVLIAAIERGDNATNVSFDVAYAYDAAEAAAFIEKEIDALTDNWQGNEQDLEFILNFVRRFLE